MATSTILKAAVLTAALAAPGRAGADAVAVRHPEGLVHGFLALRSATGEVLAGGELIQTSRGAVVTSELVFHFKDGSLHDETTVFDQSGRFKVLSYHLKQKGPSFPKPLDFTLDGKTGGSKVDWVDDGEAKTASDRIEEVPADLADGLMPILLKNIDPATPLELSMLAATPRPRMVGLKVELAGEEPLTAGGISQKALHFVVKVKLGGLPGLIAPLLGKQPPDTDVWILKGPVPAFLRSDGAMYVGGPIWRIELADPSWPNARR